MCTPTTKTINIGDGYRIRAISRTMGSFQVVAIEWEHPNYGYFADAMLWWRTLHVPTWKPISIVKWADKYKKLQTFLKKFPEFKNCFQEEAWSAKWLIETIPCDK